MSSSKQNVEGNGIEDEDQSVSGQNIDKLIDSLKDIINDNTVSVMSPERAEPIEECDSESEDYYSLSGSEEALQDHGTECCVPTFQEEKRLSKFENKKKNAECSSRFRLEPKLHRDLQYRLHHAKSIPNASIKSKKFGVNTPLNSTSAPSICSVKPAIKCIYKHNSEASDGGLSEALDSGLCGGDTDRATMATERASKKKAKFSCQVEVKYFRQERGYTVLTGETTVEPLAEEGEQQERSYKNRSTAPYDAFYPKNFDPWYDPS